VIGSNSSSSWSSRSSFSSGAVTGGDPAVHSVTQGQLAVTAGRYRAKSLGFKYRNRDGTYSVPIRALWMVINLVLRQSSILG
jgi:hypothetical protein